MPKLFSFSVLALLFMGVGLAHGQTGTVEGIVTEAASGEPLPGVNISLEGTSQGTAASAQGKFTLSAPAGDYSLVASFVGYEENSQPVTLIPGDTVAVSIEMTSATYGMDEVVVTALGIERDERSVGYSIQEVEGEAIEESPEANLVSALAGRVSGVQINSSSGQPGGSSRITIRGETSLLGNNQPLFVVDGMPISNAEDGNAAGNALFVGSSSNRALDLDPSIIQDISVLKGASATALYGSRASNGAIIITTKSGSQGRPRVTFKSRAGWSTAIIDGFQNEYLQGSQGYYTNGLPEERGGYMQPGYPGSDPQTLLSWGPHKDEVSQEVLSDLGVDEIETYDPREQFYQTGNTVETSLSISGGGDLGSYFLSASHLDQAGTVPTTELGRTSIFTRFSTSLSDNLSANASINYTNTANEWVAEGADRSYLWTLNFAPISFDLRPAEYEDGTQRVLEPSSDNPYWLVNNSDFTSDVSRYILNTTLTYDIFPNLHLKARGGLDQYTDQRKQRQNIGATFFPEGSMMDRTIDRQEINSDVTLNVDEIDLGGGLSASGLVGSSISSRSYESDVIQGQGLGIPGFYNVSNASSVSTSEYESLSRIFSVYSQATLDYNDYLFLTLTGRNDWSSTLPKDNNSYFYPSASLGFVFSDMLSLEDSFLSFGKLRFSAAQIGGDASPYSLSTTYGQASPSSGYRGFINYPYNGVNGYLLSSSLGNPELKPEISTEYEVGADLRFFNERARVDVAYYNRTTENQIFSVPTSSTTGFSSRLRNAGEIRNTGVELTLTGTPLQTDNFQWELQANWTKSHTQVVSLAPGVESIYLAGFAYPQIRIEPGEGYGVIWGTHYRRNENDELLIGDDGLPIQADGFGVIGNVQPDWTGNARSTLSYKGLSLSALIDVRQGGDILNFDKNYTIENGTAEVTENRGTTTVWEGVNVNTGEPNTVEVMRDQEYYQNFYSVTHENQVEDGSYIKLREVTLAYSLPANLLAWSPIRDLTITGAANNLWISTDFSYGDPEGSLYGSSGGGQGYYFMITPSTRNYSLSLRATF